MTPGRAALIGLIQRYLGGLMDPFVTLLEIHKLMYFMQEAGEPLKLRYAKAPYGPYAENLRHVLQSIEGYFISGYADGGDAPDKQLELVPGAIADANAFLEGKMKTRVRFDRVAVWSKDSRLPLVWNSYRPCTGSPSKSGPRLRTPSSQRRTHGTSGNANSRRGRSSWRCRFWRSRAGSQGEIQNATDE